MSEIHKLDSDSRDLPEASFRIKERIECKDKLWVRILTSVFWVVLGAVIASYIYAPPAADGRSPLMQNTKRLVLFSCFRN